MTPTAPAACALTDLTVKLQPPRSMTTILPETAAGKAWHASVTVPMPIVPAITTVLPSSARMTRVRQVERLRSETRRAKPVGERRRRAW